MPKPTLRQPASRTKCWEVPLRGKRAPASASPTQDCTAATAQTVLVTLVPFRTTTLLGVIHPADARTSEEGVRAPDARGHAMAEILGVSSLLISHDDIGRSADYWGLEFATRRNGLLGNWQWVFSVSLHSLFGGRTSFGGFTVARRWRILSRTLAIIAHSFN